MVALEEHVSFRRFARSIDPRLVAQRGYPQNGTGAVDDALDDIDGRRLELMDQAGITMQVLSVVGPGADLLPPDAGPAFARRYNDELAEVVRGRPDRFSAFAHLPLSAPEAAADEIDRCVRELTFRGALINGTTDGRFLDDPRFEPILARAETLDVPLYLHPGIPPEPVRRAYYDGFDSTLGFVFSTVGWGWHAETAVHVLRLVLSGALDRHPRLRLIIGHMGEGLPTMLARIDATLSRVAKHLQRSVGETILDHVVITTSAFFSEAPFLAALLTFGADRILFSVDYPYSENRAGREFLDRLPISPNDKVKIAHANADRVLRFNVQ